MGSLTSASARSICLANDVSVTFPVMIAPLDGVCEGFMQLSSDELGRQLIASRMAFGEVNDVAGLASDPHLR